MWGNMGHSPLWGRRDDLWHVEVINPSRIERSAQLGLTLALPTRHNNAEFVDYEVDVRNLPFPAYWDPIQLWLLSIYQRGKAMGLKRLLSLQA